MLGCILHHTAGTTAVAPHSGGSWHYLIDHDGTVYLDVPEECIAWGAAATDRWRPLWVVAPPPTIKVSAPNWCALHIELVYAPQSPFFQSPTLAQEHALRQLLADIYARLGRLPIVGHGEIQTDKWETEPHALDWAAIGCGGRTANGRYYTPPPPPPPVPVPVPEEPEMTPDERSILDSAAQQTAAGHTIRHGGDLDWWIGTWQQLASDKESLAQLLQRAQQERDEAMAEVARLKAQTGAVGAVGAVVDIRDVTVRFVDGREVTR